MKRALDITLAAAALCLAAPLMVALAGLVRLTSPGPAIHWSRRVGRDERLFWMPKFRTMVTTTPEVATHLLADPDRWITPLGRWLRRSSLDELPQLVSVLLGQMSFVGPRPALFNQTDLIELRRASGAAALRPGLTGLAQINGRDHLELVAKARLDGDYARSHTLWLDVRILLATALQAASGSGVREGAQAQEPSSSSA